MKRALISLLTFVALDSAPALTTVGPWAPLLKAVDYATGQMTPDQVDRRLQAVHALRFDLTDPDLRMFGMPPCANCGAEVLSTTPCQFLADYGLQVAVNCNFFDPNSMTPGTPTDVLGLAISQGVVLSPTNDSDHPVALLFTTNNRPFFIPTNLPPTNTTGIYTAVSGNHLLVLHGVNVANPTNDVDPRTALGISQDGRYLYAIIIDGRQEGYSDGATYYETADWLIRFGAYHGMNVDGGSCATMVVEDCAGAPLRLNSNSYAVTHAGRERGVGHLVGFHTKPLPGLIRDVTVVPSDTTAIIVWNTPEPATTEVEFGATTNYGRRSARCDLPLTNHVMTLSDLAPATTYFFRVLSVAGTNAAAWPCHFSTVSTTVTNRLFDLTQPWKFTTNNLDGLNWTAPGYDDSAWLGPGPALLCVETNASVFPRNTTLPPAYGNPIPTTYYFRTRFNFPRDTAGVGLMFSNYIDDGAVFHLNGNEIRRLRMRPAPAAISNATLAGGFACSNATYGCSGDACTSCPDLFTVPANVLTNLHPGENTLAIEVHNYSAGSLDVVFGAALFALEPYAPSPALHLLRSGDVVTLFWNGAALTLQETTQLGTPESWADVAGPVTNSPCVLTNLAGSRFFRLRR